jgi:hypothetical protein
MIMTKHTMFHTVQVGLLALMMAGTLSACSKSGIDHQSATRQTGRAEVREAPAEPTGQPGSNPGNAPLDVGTLEQRRTEFMTGCRTSCTNQDTSQGKAAFCELYCDCTHANLRMKVPANELQAFSEGKKPASSDTIETIRHQCASDANTAITGSTQ